MKNREHVYLIEYVGKCLCINENGKKILAVGDLHLGYEEVLNEAGMFVTREMFKEMIRYLDRVFESTGSVDYVVLLGDVKHNFARILRQECSDVLNLFTYLKEKLKYGGEIIVVKGNHDKILGPVVKRGENVRVVDYYIAGDYCFAHGDREYKEMNAKEAKYWILGHGHPAIKLSDGVKVEKYKCFLTGRHRGKEVIIVPSFLEYSEGSDPRENDLGMAWGFDFDKFGVFVVGEEDLRVKNFGKLEKIK